MKIIHKARVGSHLFGTSTPTSDIDIKGVFIPSAKEILKPNTQSHLSLSTGDDRTKNTSDDVDEEYYALHKFMDMLGKGDMVATEMLFAPYDGLQLYSDTRYHVWKDIFENRHKILSRECKGFVGYVQRQANTYSVKGDRLNELKATIDFLNELARDMDVTSPAKLMFFPGFRDEVRNFCKDKNHTSWELVTVNGKEVFHFICCDRKVPDTVTFSVALSVFQKVLNEYGNRARAAASADGHDWKALSHAVRVGDEAIELLTYGKITFPRPNAAYLLDIKLGKVPYSEVAEELDALLACVEDEVSRSVLPEKPDYKWMAEFIETQYESEVVSAWSGKNSIGL